jgi:hypothetical protein
MPSTTHTPVRAFAHCTASRCPGNRQVEIDAIEEETSWLFSDNGGDWPFVEKSSVNLRFVNVEEQHCPTCGRSRDLSSTKRPAFDGSMSGYDPNGPAGDAGQRHRVRPGQAGRDPGRSGDRP